MSEGAKKRGRPKGSLNKPKGNGHDAEPKIPTSDDRPAAEARNGSPKVAKEPLNDDQEHALVAHHAAAYEKLLAAKKAADAKFKNGVKLAKSEGVSLAHITEYLDYQTEEGQERLREEIARKHKVARWAGLPVGTQLSFFEERVPLEDEVAADGKRSGLKGEPCNPPRTLPGNLMETWSAAWQSGQAILASKHMKQKAEDAAAFDDDFPPAA